MRVPLSWLAEYVDLAPGTTPEDVHAALVKVGFEEEDIHTSDVTGPLVVGKVLEFTPEEQSNGKTIRWCQVEVGASAAGEADVRGIVCGASNFEVGDKVVVSLPGAVLPGGFEIAARKTYGHVSDGMMASFKELGLGDDHSGIIRLNTMGVDPEVGSDAIALLGLDDSAVEINVTPDRGYAFSIRGVAREYAHSTGATFRDPATHLPAIGGAHLVAEFSTEYPVNIDNSAPIRNRAGVNVFVTRIVRGIDAKRSTPQWMSSRLRLAGIRPISLAVDITNYVMLELGQPIHGYDLDQLNGTLGVRRAKAGEKLTTLDGVERALNAEDLLITDNRGPIGLAGVMGGAETELSDATVNVLVEAANFDPVSIARTARRHKLPSEASKRFERGVDPEVAEVAAGRVVQLLVDLAGGTAEDHGSFISLLEPAQITRTIELPANFVTDLIGYEYTPAQIRETLAEIGATVVDGRVDPQGRIETYAVTPPSWRPDLTDKWTLAEEVARITGFDVIPTELPVAPPGRGYTTSQQVRRRVSDALAAAGLTETLSYPFFDEATNNLFATPTGEPVAQIRLSNALDASQGWMRTSILPGLLGTAARNRSRGFSDVAVFELGRVFLPEAGKAYGHEMFPGAVRPTEQQLAAVAAGLPPQPYKLAAVFSGDAVLKQPGTKAAAFDYTHALDALKTIALGAGVEIEVRQGSHASFHPGRCAEVVIGDGTNAETVIGYAGEIHPEVAESFNLAGRVAALELDLDALSALAGNPVEAEAVPVMPAATQDLSLVVNAEIPADAVLAAVVAGAGELLEDARLVDVYAGEGLPEGTRSLTFALRFRASDRTLTQAEATEAKQAGVAAATAAFGATIRE